MAAPENFNSLAAVARRFRDNLDGNHQKEKDLVLMFAHNGTGKTRLSVAFKNLGKTDDSQDTLYFNAFTEDLFSWNNDLENDTERFLNFNQDSAFFDGLRELDMGAKIEAFFHNYVDLKFDIDYDAGTIKFSRSILIEEEGDERAQTIENIKISRGEENLFIWCFFLAVVQLAIDGDESYGWVKYIYVDDPISSLDENNAIAVACDLANLITDDSNQLKTVISTHHSLFFNVMFNEVGRKLKSKRYFMHHRPPNAYLLQDAEDSPFYHHIAVLSELRRVVDQEVIHTYHFNALRSILEKTATFFGYGSIEKCIVGLEDEVLFKRALQLFSHGKYSVFDPAEMVPDTKALFKKILDGFLDKYEFNLPEIFAETST